MMQNGRRFDAPTNVADRPPPLANRSSTLAQAPTALAQAPTTLARAPTTPGSSSFELEPTVRIARPGARDDTALAADGVAAPAARAPHDRPAGAGDQIAGEIVVACVAAGPAARTWSALRDRMHGPQSQQGSLDPREATRQHRGSAALWDDAVLQWFEEGDHPPDLDRDDELQTEPWSRRRLAWSLGASLLAGSLLLAVLL